MIRSQRILIILIAIAVLSACTQNSDNKLIIGIIKPSLNHLPLQFGFKIEALEEEEYLVKNFNSGWETNEALVTGKIDVAILPFTYIWMDVANGKQVKVISFLERESDGIITTKEHTKLGDLNGKKIGVLRASTLDIFAEMTAEKYNLDFDLIYFRTPMDMAAALKAGEVEALSYYVPSIFKFSDDFRIIHWYSEDYPAHTCCDIAATETALNSKLDKTKKFLKGIQKSTLALNNSPNSIIYDVVKEFYDLPAKYAKPSLRHTKYITGLSKEKKEFELKTIKRMVEKDYIKRMVTPEEIYFEKK